MIAALRWTWRSVGITVPKLAAVLRHRLFGVVLVAALLAMAAGLPAAGATGASRSAARVSRLPAGFVGIVVDEPVWPDPWIDLNGQMDKMAASGLESVRVVFDWSHAQPYRHWKDVPKDQHSNFVNVGGVPTNFSSMDQIVTAASQHGLRVLPVVLNAPAWDGEHNQHAVVDIPKASGPYAAFVKALVRRYGPNGTLWQFLGNRPHVPVTMWQIWNEPNILAFWPDQPFQTRYVGLLRAASKAIKSADPSARIVLAGMPNYSWLALGRVYKVAGARALFDVVAVHPYTKDPQGVLTILGYVRRVMDQNGDQRKPIIADEISWPSSVGKTNHDTGYDFATTESGQAKDLRAVLPMLVASRKRLNLLGFYYYDWAGLERHNALAFEFAGLFRVQDGKFVAKPAYQAYKQRALAMEGCSSKGTTVSSCQP